MLNNISGRYYLTSPQVPEIPETFKQRPDAQQKLLSALLSAETSATKTSVTAPASRLSSFGMGQCKDKSTINIMLSCSL